MKHILILALSLHIFSPILADDWPHWMGPQRDNTWREEGLLEKFPQGGPKIVWRTAIAGGYSGPAVTKNRLYVTDYVTTENSKIENFKRDKSFTGKERVLCLNAKNGSEVWHYEYPVTYTISYPSGPRCTPIVHQGKVYTLGAEGNLLCFDAEEEKLLWSHDLKKEYKTKAALWGYSAHPLIDGNKLITLVGGEGSHVVAFDKDTGKELWKALTSSEQGYSPPTIINASGVRQLILYRPDAVTSLNPENGQEYWSIPYQATNGSIIMAPIVWKDLMYVAGFSNKSLLLKLGDKPGATEVWRDKKGAGICPVNVQPFNDNGTLYGFDQSGIFYGMEIASGKRLWQTTDVMKHRAQGSETGFIVKQGDRYWIFNELGELIICKLSPEGYKEIDRAKVIDMTNTAFGRDVVWCMPAFANKRMYVRNDKECICVELAK
ncbi:MAG: PQQ-like beta-propeller repeat protein [Gemmatales bacterium]